MEVYFFAVPLPSSIRSRLASLCFGLPQVHWVEEENFYLMLRHFGPLSNLLVAEIHDRLLDLFFPPFSLPLQGVGYFHAKGKRGIIWVGVAHNLPLATLQKEIDRRLRGLAFPSSERNANPHIRLGYYERLHSHKLADYLSTHMHDQFQPIEVTSCELVRSFQTPKRTLFETVEHYDASQMATGED
jgi:RNA 2',3'-cyclic 3'-phosphodiesterase